MWHIITTLYTGIVGHSVGLPDIHSGYGFAIGKWVVCVVPSVSVGIFGWWLASVSVCLHIGCLLLRG